MKNCGFITMYDDAIRTDAFREFHIESLVKNDSISDRTYFLLWGVTFDGDRYNIDIFDLSVDAYYIRDWVAEYNSYKSTNIKEYMTRAKSEDFYKYDINRLIYEEKDV